MFWLVVTFDGVVIRGQKSERRGTNGDMNDKSSDASWSELLSDSFTARKHENHRVLSNFSALLIQ